MKTKGTAAGQKGEADLLKESPAAPGAESAPMIRTQIYLSKSEYEFLQAESRRCDQPMAAVLRSFIDEKMRVPDAVWKNSPLLQPPADDPDYESRGDGVVNHDHYIYGGPKKYKKVKGKWTLQPALK